MNTMNGPRLSSRLTRLGQIGFVPGEGTTRLPYLQRTAKEGCGQWAELHGKDEV